MNSIIQSITNYNIFNFLFPGIIFVILVEHFTQYTLIKDYLENNALYLIFALSIFYFIGMIISRIGSIIIELFLKYINFIKFLPYEDLNKTRDENDNRNLQLNNLINQSNQYRTIISLLILFGGIKIYEICQSIPHKHVSTEFIIIYFILILIFLFSYRKQTRYITSFIKPNQK